MGNRPTYPQVSLSGRPILFPMPRKGQSVMASGRLRQGQQYAVCPGQDHLKSSTNTHNLTTRRCRQNKTQPTSATLKHPCRAHPSQGSFAKLPLISCACSHQMELWIPITYLQTLVRRDGKSPRLCITFQLNFHGHHFRRAKKQGWEAGA